MKRVMEEKIVEIARFAKNNENRISFRVVEDILKDKEQLTQRQILEVIEELGREGIAIVPEEEEGYPAQETSSDKFIPAEVNIGQRPVTVYHLMERLENHEIDLNPDFQRKGDLWSAERQSRLIESLMLKIPIPAFYFNATEENCWVVIDGLQRLTAFLKFLVGKEGKKEKFVGLQYLKDFNHHTFDELPRQYVRRIKETSIVAYTVEKGTPDEIVYNIFQRINTGGIALNEQEIRQALYQGEATRLIERLAESEEFLGATQSAVSTDRMQDREFITRFLAFTELDYKNVYAGDIDSFLIKGMKLVNTYDREELSRIEEKFKRIMGCCAAVFGKYAFRKYNEDGRRGPINKALFEMWVVCFSELDQGQMDRIIKEREEFLKEFFMLQRNPEFNTALKAGDQYSVARRIELARKMVREFL